VSGGPEAPEPVLIAVTDHAVERFRQRVGGRAGRVDARPEIVSRVGKAWQAGRIERGERAEVRVRDLVDRDLVFVCRHDRPRGELVVVTLWEPGRIGEPRVARDVTKALGRTRRGRGDVP
jgi:hypothetical protein